MEPRSAVEQAFADEWGRIVAALIHRTGDWDLAEECAAQAFAEAVRRWPREGVPRSPGAWLTTVARNRAIDRLRHERMKADRLRRAAALLAADRGGDDIDLPSDEDEADSGIEDERLRLVFTCCHPALPLEGRVALTLRSLAGLTTAEIARAFLAPEAAMAKRLVRAKQKIAHAGIPFRVPPAHLLPSRTSGVLAVLYLLFNEGYAASGGENLIRADLCEEAIRLARGLTTLLPDEPEAEGLLALMLLQHSRRRARVDDAGELLTLEEQDRTLWDHAACTEARALLERAIRRRHAGPYQLQAAIAACHADAASAAETDWDQIRALYERLLEVMPGPVVRLNHAVATAMSAGPAAGLALVEQLRSDRQLDGYYLLHATRADLLRRLGRTAEAGAAYRQALEHAGADAERRYLTRRLAEVESPEASSRRTGFSSAG